MEQEEVQENYLYDFIYLNHESLAFYNAQLDKDGLLTGSVVTHAIADESGNNVGVDVKLFKAGGADKSTHSKSTQSQFDTTAAMPLNVIRELNNRGLINTDIEAASIGQIVLFSGRLQIIDYDLMSEILKPALKYSSKTASKKTAADRMALNNSKIESESFIELIEKMPKLVQFRIFDDENSAWGTISSGKLMVNTWDFTMKHDVSIAGEWHILAVLDALPEIDSSNPTHDYAAFKYMTELETMYTKAFLQLRTMLGRRMEEYGIMPLAIFRKVE